MLVLPVGRAPARASASRTVFDRGIRPFTHLHIYTLKALDSVKPDALTGVRRKFQMRKP